MNTIFQKGCSKFFFLNKQTTKQKQSSQINKKETNKQKQKSAK